MSKAKNEFKPKTTAEKIEVMQAYERGEEIEYYTRPHNSLDFADWKVPYKPNWNWVDYDYRVKPKPVTKTIYYCIYKKGDDFTTSPLYENKVSFDFFCIGASYIECEILEKRTLEVQV